MASTRLKKDKEVKKDKKEKKSKEASEETFEFEPVLVYKRAQRITAAKYLMLTGAKPHHIDPKVFWARNKGYVTATKQEWEELFKSY